MRTPYRIPAFSFCASLLAVGLTVAPAVAKPMVALNLSGSVVGQGADGKPTLTPLQSTNPKPGDAIRWTVTARNNGDSAAAHLATVEKVPVGTVYVDGSARADGAHVEFSLDGKTWSPSPTIQVKDADGKVVVRKAPPSTYVALRFVSDGALAPHAQTTSTYQTRVK